MPQRSPLEGLEKLNAIHRARVEHPFLTIKRIFGYAKVRDRGLAKNTNRLYVLAALTNMMRARPYMAT